ncbi:MAG: hypothetical protein ACRD5K_14595 [Candidatus Acidiferrales bacterium]
MRITGRIVSVALLFLGSLLLMPQLTLAQMRVMHAAPMGGARHTFHPIRVAPSATHGIATPRARVNTAAPPAHVRAFRAPAHELGNNFGIGSGETLQQLLDPVPGPGFSYAHLGAIDSDLAVKAVIDPETEWRLAVAERVLRDTGGDGAPGYYLLDGGGEYVVPEPASSQAPPQSQQPPQIIVLQQPAQKSAEESAPAAAPQPAAPIPDVSTFTLVLQNRKKIQAIAVTRSGDRIVYITADGARHSIAARQLNLAATERVNQDGGIQLTL